MTFKSYVRSAYDAYRTARERQAQRYINEALAALDEKTLTRLGYSPSEVKKRASFL